MVELRAFKVNKLEVENTVAPGTQLKLQNQVKYNVNYMDGDKKCIGILELRVADADLQPFEIKIEAVAEFATAMRMQSRIFILRLLTSFSRL